MVQIYEGMKLVFPDETTWRLFLLGNEHARLIQMNVSKIVFKTMTLSELLDLVISGKAVVPEDQEITVVNRNNLKADMLKSFEKNLEFVRKAENIYGEGFVGFASKIGCSDFIKLYQEMGYSRSKAFRLVRKWLQSNKSDAGIIDERYFKNAKGNHIFKSPTGTSTSKLVLDQSLIEKFDDGVYFFSKNRLVTYKDAYDFVILKYFSENKDGVIVPFPMEVCPTYRQFYNHIKRKLTKEEIERIKTSNREYRNNCRLIAGTPRDDALRPGMIVEVDALEVDIAIVSSDIRSEVIGRPVLYAMVDVYSHAIVAFSVGLDNNSNLALGNLMMNLVEDKKEFLERNGISEFDDTLWPSCFIPREIRCDNGSDFKSKQFEEVCRRLGITKTNEPPATGSYKGLVEQLFRTFHRTFKSELEHKGVIQNRYDSKHYRDACLTLHETLLLFLNFMFWYNSHYIQSFNLPNDMILAGVKKTPISVWQYGVKNKGFPTPVTQGNRMNYYFNIMEEVKARVSREGVLYKNLVYNTDDDIELLARMKLAKSNEGKRDVHGTSLNEIKVMRDLRDITNLYYEKDGEVKILALNYSRSPEKRAMTWSEYEERYSAVKKIDAKGKEDNRAKDLQSKYNVGVIGADCEKKAIPTTQESIRENRKREKEKENVKNAVSQKNAVPNSSPEMNAIETDKEEINMLPTEDKKDNGTIPSLLSDDCPEELFNL